MSMHSPSADRRPRRGGARLFVWRSIVACACAALALPVSATAAAAQGAVQVTLTGIPPVLPSPFLGDVERDVRSGRYLALVVVTGQEHVSTRLRFTLELDGRLLAETTSDPVLLAPGTYTYRTFSELPKFTFPESMADLADRIRTRLGNQVITSGVLPEGRYTVRLTPLPQQVGTVAVAGVATFLVRYPAPARPMTPTQGQVIATRNPVFSWVMPDVTPGAQHEFELNLVEMLPGQTPVQAIQGNRPILRETIRDVTTFVYTPDRLPLDTAREYAWRLITQVRMSGHLLPVREGGLSEIRTFRVAPPAPSAPTAPVPPSTPAAPSGATIASCDVAPPGNTTAAPGDASSFVGRTLRLGRFALTVTEATGTAGSLDGRGHIEVPYLRRPLAVSFTGLGVNPENQVFAGSAVALPAPAAGGALSPGLLGTFSGGAESLAPEALGPAIAAARGAGQWVSALAGSAPVGLPLGLEAGMTGTGWALVVLGAGFSPAGAQANIVLDAPLPALGGGLSLGARGVCIDPDGIGSGSETVLALLKETTLSVGGIEHRFTGAAGSEPGTHAVWAKSAFRSLRIAMDVRYPRSMLIPLNGDGTRRSGEVVTRFTATLTDAASWIATGTLERSELAGLPGFSIVAPQVLYDNSLGANPAGMAFPSGYEGATGTSWTGFYVPELTLELPPALRAAAGAPIRAQARGLLIDATGVSVAASLTNLVPRTAPGTLAGWGYSLDRLTVELAHSALKKGEMAGGVILPVGEDAIPYTALLSRTGDRTGFQFRLQPASELNARLWMARMTLAPTSHLSVRDTMIGGATSFHAEAVLDGKLSITGNIEGFPVDFRLIGFERLGFTSAAPYVTPGTWKLASPQHGIGGEDGDVGDAGDAGSAADRSGGAGGFPVEITSIAPQTRSASGGATGIGLGFDLRLSVPGAESWFSATGGLVAWGRVTPPGSGPMRAQFDELVLRKVNVKGELAGVLKADGTMEFYKQHDVFGTGIGGDIKATVLGTAEASAAARFGSRLGTSYWYVDLAYTSATGVPLTSGIGLYGLGGGASRHITRTLPSASALMSGGAAPREYRVDPAAALELRASAVIGTHPTPKPFNADVRLGATFTGSGGLAKLEFGGDGYFMTEGVIDRPASPPARATVALLYAPGPPRIFTGDFTLLVNYPPITGQGRSVMYFAPDKWYVRAGNPADPRDIGLRVGIGGIGVNTHSYLYVGDDLPPMPPPPAGAPQPTDPMPTTAGGSGFAFGSRANFAFDETYLIFYAALDAGLGFDLAMRHPTTCDGIPGLAGVRGWYANGQMYAYLKGAVGIDVNTWLYRGRLEAFGVTAGALMRGGAPNPVWADGSVHGSYRLLRGLVSGSVNFQISLGDRCLPSGPGRGLLSDLDLITDIQPAEGVAAADVFTHPSVAFAMRLNETLDLVDDQGRRRYIRIRSDGIQLRLAGSTVPVAGTTALQEGGSVMVLAPADALEDQRAYQLRVNAYAEEYVNGAWVRARGRDGAVLPEQVKVVDFRSGRRPNRIVAEHVAYTYPINRQRFFLAAQVPEGRVEFNRGQNYGYLLTPLQSGNSVQVLARFAPVGGGAPIESPARIEAGRIRFTLPPLARSTTYALQLVRKETGPTTVAMTMGDRPGIAQIRTIAASRDVGAGVQVDIQRRALAGATVMPAGERLLYTAHFRTSQHGTLQEKMAAASVNAPRAVAYSQALDVPVRVPEGFDVFDLVGTATVPPLLDVRSMLPFDNTRWMREWSTPNVYQARIRLQNTGLFGALSGLPHLFLMSGSGTGVLRVSGATPRAPLSDAEIGAGQQTQATSTTAVLTPMTTYSSAVTGLLGATGMTLTATHALQTEPAGPTYTFRYGWPQGVYEDWRTVRHYANAAITIYNTRPFARPFDGSTYQYLLGAAGRGFTPPFAGQYPIEFRARYPWGGTPPSGTVRINFTKP